ncbi:hypothetical protein [Endozoicomonas sp. ALD040]|uniref:hypothetical protein n=1 Tax=unclassified Endozoicomonas TaxID=2644528 RepID=UPI003BAFD991
MAPASGNVNDKTCFQEIIKNHLSCFKAALNSRYVVTTGLVSLDRGTENIAKIIELWKEE